MTRRQLTRVRTAALLALTAAVTDPAPAAAQTSGRPSAAPPLQVLRAAPQDTAAPGSVVTFTLDRPPRPAPGGGAPDPAALVRVEPAAPVRVRWADPVTLRVVPAEPLVPGRRYTVTLAPGLEALDGGRLLAPARVTFTVRAPSLTASDPMLTAQWGVDLPPSGRVLLAYDGPLDPARLARGARLDFATRPAPGDVRARACTGRPPVRFTAVAREPRPDDPYQLQRLFQPRGRPQRRPGSTPTTDAADETPDRFRRVIELRPSTAPPAGCAAVLHLPAADPVPGGPRSDPVRYPVRTAPAFALAALSVHDTPDDDSALLALHFTAPVRGADVLAHVRLEPARPFTLTGAPEWPNTTWTIRTSLTTRTRHRAVAGAGLRDTAGRPITGARTAELVVGGRTPRVGYDAGLVTVPALNGRPALRVRHVNVEQAELTVWAVPTRLRARVLGLGVPNARTLAALGLGEGTRTLVPLVAPRDSARLTAVPLPAPADAEPGALLAARVSVARARPESEDSGPRGASGGRRPRVQVMAPPSYSEPPHERPLALVQTGDLAVHVKAAPGDGGLAFVTRLSDGAPVAGAQVTMYDTAGYAAATGGTGADGVARLSVAARPLISEPPPTASDTAQRRSHGHAPLAEGPHAVPLVEVTFGGARVVEVLAGERGVDWSRGPLLPWRLGGQPGAGPRARATLYADRDLFRPGETVHLAAVARDGALSQLQTPAGAWTRLRVVGQPGYGGELVVRDTVLRLDAFGTAVDSVRLNPALPLGYYFASLARWRAGTWEPLAGTSFRLAEYRAPEFRVTLTPDSGARFLGDTVRARVDGRLLFDAPMAGATVRWSATLAPATSWEQAALPGLDDGWVVGGADGPEFGGPPVQEARREGADQQGILMLDARGQATVAVPTVRGLFARPGRLQLDVAVTDLSRQTVTSSTAVTVHAADVYLAARDSGGAWVWPAGVPRTVRVLARRPNGQVAPGVRVRTAVVALRWVPDRQRGPWGGRWAADTIARDSLVTGRTAADTARLRVTPPARADRVAVVLTASDSAGRPATTVLHAHVAGGGELAWWSPGTEPARLAVLAARRRAAAGDTVEVRFTSPFDSAEAWVTVERERVLRAWRMRVGRGPGVVRVPVAEEDAPNVFVGVLLARRAPALAGEPLEARLRAGYAALEVDRAPRRLAIELRDQRRDTTGTLRYAPGDTSRLQIRVRDAREQPVSATVALWAVDEGVLSVTGTRRPSVLDALYGAEGLGLVLGSTLTRLGDQQPPWRGGGSAIRIRGAIAASRVDDFSTAVATPGLVAAPPAPAPPPPAEAGVAGGRATGDPAVGPVRSVFRSTAFYLGAVRTDARGEATANPVLPDNLTTFRVTAVAVAAGDAYGDTDTPLVVAKPLVVRAALPRFVRPGDSLAAGGVVTVANSVVGRRGSPTLRMRADARGLARLDSAEQVGPPPIGGGAERRWRWQVPTDVDSGAVHVRLSAVLDGSAETSSGGRGGSPVGPLGDAVEVALPVRPAYAPRAHAAAGMVANAPADVRLLLSAELDPARSRLVVRAGPSPLPAVRAAWAELARYPYDGSEQLASAGRALVALLRLHAAGAPGTAGDSALRPRLQDVVDALARRQRDDGAIGYWSRAHWTTAWLSAEVGLVLLDAAAVGARVEPFVLERLSRFLADSARAAAAVPAVSADSFGTRADRRRLAARVLAGRLAALDYLRRAGVPEREAERSLAGQASALAWEDRARLAELLARGGDAAGARRLLDALWATVGRAGVRAELPDSLLWAADFPSRVRPAARLLLATLTVRPAHPRVGELVERLLQRQRAEPGYAWNTQDLSASAAALGELARRGGWAPARVRVRAADGRALLVADVGSAAGPAAAGASALDASAEAGVPLTGLVTREGDGQVLALRVEREAVPGRAAGAPTAPGAVAPGAVGAFYAVTVHEVPNAAAQSPPARDSRGLVVERWYERLADGRPALAVAAGELVRVRLRVTAPADREFVALEDPLPAGLEPVDLSLRTSGTLAPFAGGDRRGAPNAFEGADDARGSGRPWWGWSPWEHIEQRDDAVRWFARRLASGTYAVSYVARATTAGRFARVPAHAEEMYNPALAGRTEGGRFTVADERVGILPP